MSQATAELIARLDAKEDGKRQSVKRRLLAMMGKTQPSELLELLAGLADAFAAQDEQVDHWRDRDAWWRVADLLETAMLDAPVVTLEAHCAPYRTCNNHYNWRACLAG